MPAESTFGARAYRFYTRLATPRVPRGVTVMNPYADKRVRRCLRAFLDKYFADNEKRTLVIGINPGRFGAGITGVTFTDPIRLADACGIDNHLARVPEPSSVFVYDAIARCGGPDAFYARNFLTAACPLGFTRAGVNLNYYDVPALQRAVTPFIVQSIQRQLAIGGRRDRAVVIGTGKNLKFMQALNAEHGFFGVIESLEHPRFIQQYRYKQRERYLARYAEVLGG